MTKGEGLHTRGDTLTPQQQAQLIASIATMGLNGGADNLVIVATRPDGPLRELAPPDVTTV